MQTITIGRAGIDTTTGNVTDVSEDGQRLTVSGRTPYGTLEEALAVRAQLLGYVNSSDESFVPVTWSAFPHLDGYYRFDSVRVSMPVATALSGIFTWDVTLAPVQGFAAPLIESVCLGKLRTSTMSLTPRKTISVPTASLSYAAYFPSLNTFIPFTPIVVREGPSGDVAVFSWSGDDRIISQFYLPPADFYEAAATLRMGSPLRVVVGRQVANLPLQWQMSNEVLQVRALAGSAFAVQFRMWNVGSWSAWQSLTLWGGGSSGAAIAALAAPHTITVLANSPEAVTIRLLTTTPGEYAPATVDLTLRRGARFVGVELHSIFVSEFHARISGFTSTTALTGGRSGPNGGGTGVITFAGSALVTRSVSYGDQGYSIGPYQSSVLLVTHFPFCFGLTNANETPQTMLNEYFWAGSDKQTVVAR